MENPVILEEQNNSGFSLGYNDSQIVFIDMLSVRLFLFVINFDFGGQDNKTRTCKAEEELSVSYFSNFVWFLNIDTAYYGCVKDFIFCCMQLSPPWEHIICLLNWYWYTTKFDSLFYIFLLLIIMV